MTNFAAQVKQLYRHYGTWRKVADACGGGYSRAYYWRIANGKISRPCSDSVHRIVTTSSMLPKRELQPVTRATRNARRNVSFNLATFDRMEQLKRQHSATWNELAEMMLEAME